MKEKNIVKNVAAAIIVNEDKFFITQRGYGEFKGKWEFPGGKIETGESGEVAVIREIKEELNTDIKVMKLLCSVEYDYSDFHLNMECYLCEVIKGNLDLIEHQDSKWIKINEVDNIDFLEADKEVIEELKKYYKLK